MRNRDCYYWLTGYFELRETKTALSLSQVEIILKHLSLVETFEPLEAKLGLLKNALILVKQSGKPELINITMFEEILNKEMVNVTQKVEVAQKVEAAQKPFTKNPSFWPYEPLGEIYSTQRIC